ncbi:MAG: Sapep family Mn(2+)-dependent dipeptidase [Oliverpabstia sp.]
MYYDAIRDYLWDHREEFLKDLALLVSIDSQNCEPEAGKPYGDGPARALDAFLRLAEQYGFSAENWEYQVGVVTLGLPEGQSEKRKLDILAHLDVVPAGEGWEKTEPFVMLEEAGRVYGRGTADDKGPALAALYAMRAVRDLRIPLQEGLRLVVGCDEEMGGGDMDYYYGKTSYAPATFSPDGDFPVINIEKGMFSGVFAAKISEEEKEGQSAETKAHITAIQGGVADNMVPPRCIAKCSHLAYSDFFDILKDVEKSTGTEIIAEEDREDGITFMVTGTAAHASTPDLGNNAVTAMLELLYKLPLKKDGLMEKLEHLHRMFPHGDHNGRAAGIYMKDEISGKITVSLNRIELKNGILTGCFDARTPLCATEDKRKPVGLLLKAGGFDCELHFSDPHHVPEDSPFVQILLRNYERVSGKVGRCIAIGGGTYVHDVPNGVAFGCAVEGVDNRMHGSDEFAEIQVLLDSSRMFAGVIADLCGAPEESHERKNE